MARTKDFKRDAKGRFIRTGSLTRSHYKSEAKKMWKDKHGPIPKGYVIHHLDWNRKNNILPNLVLLSQKSHELLHYSNPHFRNKISEGKMGHTVSKETRLKISQTIKRKLAEGTIKKDKLGRFIKCE